MRTIGLPEWSKLSDLIFKSRLAFGLSLALLLGFFLPVLSVQATTDVIIEGIATIGTDGVAAENEVVLLGTQDDIDALLAMPEFSELNLLDSYTDLAWLPSQPDDLTLALVRIPSETPVEEMVGNITTSATPVNASPNYLMTGLESSIIGGSPSANPLRNATPLGLKNQWAMDFIGLPASTIMPTGDGVRVLVFDAFCDITTPEKYVTLGPNICGHGGGVEHVVRTLAPDADVKRIEVLDDQLVGDLWILLTTTSNTVSDTLDLLGSDTLANTVWNFSLGMMAPAEDDVEVMKTVFEGINELDGVIIAAPGNDDSPLADVPARYTFTLSVGAIGSDGLPATYSNPGTVYAPGGQGGCGSDPAACLLTLPDTSSSITDHSYVAGTSFAAPFVTGLAAMAWEEGATSSTEVIDAIVDNASAHSAYGVYYIMNISDTLSAIP